ncbi:enoyl-(Acyl carrier protein) reductase domain-containing protein [Sarocladium implicatum]|nr:enoyl-(Acyl carrier protein) reductase domain-containing protein [Sarocladium implicatum]
MSPRPKVAIVTGGADGFGAAIVDRFTSEGWVVIIIDIHPTKGQAKAAANPNIEFLCADVTKRETWEEAVKIATEKYMRIDLVVNNAGIGHDPLPAHELDMNLFDKLFTLNVKTIFISAQVVAPVMLEQGSGAFVNISSTGYTRPRPGMSIYNATKAAVANCTKTMAMDYAPVIRFNAIAPAVGNTSMLRDSIGSDKDAQARLQRLKDSLPMKRITEPSDVANAAWYLGTEQSSFVTGTVLEVDGGRGV